MYNMRTLFIFISIKIFFIKAVVPFFNPIINACNAKI